MTDAINPKHYKIIPAEACKLFAEKGGMEYMDIMRYVIREECNPVDAIQIGQVMKYLMRFGGKDDILQEAKKAAWYANRLVEEIEGRRDSVPNAPSYAPKEKEVVYPPLEMDSEDYSRISDAAISELEETGNAESEVLDEIHGILFSCYDVLDNISSKKPYKSVETSEILTEVEAF